MSKPKGVRVRGTCANDHVTEHTSDPGRVQWFGECGTDGCTEQVRCRRIPGDAGPPPPTARAADPSQSKSKVKEVRFREQPKRKPVGKQEQDDASGGGGDGAGGGPTGVQQPAGQPAGAAGSGGDGSGGGGDEPGPGEQPQRTVERQRRDPVGRWSGSSRVRGAVERSRERGRRRREAEKDWIIPNVLPR